MAAFDVWLLIVGLVVGAGLVWLVLADSSRREAEILEEELPVEAAWISAALADEGTEVDQATAERMLRLHRVYLASLPPDDQAQASGDAEDDTEAGHAETTLTGETRSGTGSSVVARRNR